MDQTKQNFRGSFWFIPLFIQCLRSVLGMIGDAQTVYDIVTVPGIIIHWDVIWSFVWQGCAVTGVLYLAHVNWGWVLQKRKEGQQARRKKIREPDWSVQNAINYISKTPYRTSLPAESGEFIVHEAIMNYARSGDLFLWHTTKGGKVIKLQPSELENLFLTRVSESYSSNFLGITNRQEKLIFFGLQTESQKLKDLWPK
ncbi:MAG: hypothetical protein JWO78_174 [Micavibrio sp.]|nr:hypothetical protein [Micavibrio sp.]